MKLCAHPKCILLENHTPNLSPSGPHAVPNNVDRTAIVRQPHET